MATVIRSKSTDPEYESKSCWTPIASTSSSHNSELLPFQHNLGLGGPLIRTAQCQVEQLDGQFGLFVEKPSLTMRCLQGICDALVQAGELVRAKPGLDYAQMKTSTPLIWDSHITMYSKTPRTLSASDHIDIGHKVKGDNAILCVRISTGIMLVAVWLTVRIHISHLLLLDHRVDRHSESMRCPCRHYAMMSQCQQCLIPIPARLIFLDSQCFCKKWIIFVFSHNIGHHSLWSRF